MAWVTYTHADIGRVNRPRPLARCDRCGFIWNRDRLKPQYEWAGVKQMSLGVLVCPKCIDASQPQLKTLTLPPDPVPILNPRPGEFSGMVISSSPEVFASAFNSEMVVEIAPYTSSNPLDMTRIGNRTPIVTQDSSLPLLTEITVVPNPDPEYGGTVGTTS